jgi:hypothetical protein
MMIGTREEVTAVEAEVTGALLSLLLSLTEPSVEEESSTTERVRTGLFGCFQILSVIVSLR